MFVELLQKENKMLFFMFPSLMAVEVKAAEQHNSPGNHSDVE